MHVQIAQEKSCRMVVKQKTKHASSKDKVSMQEQILMRILSSKLSDELSLASNGMF